jgi:hypothetical protein
MAAQIRAPISAFSLSTRTVAGGAMIDEVLGKALEWMLAQGGGYVLSLFAGFFAWILYKQNNELTEKANNELREQYEKRLNEFKELLDVMNNSTNTVNAMHNSLTASSEAINQLALGFTTLLNEFHAQQGRWDDRRGAIADQLKDIQQRLEELRRRAA